MPSESVRVVTLNFWGRSGAWDEQRSVLIDGLQKSGLILWHYPFNISS
jgi:hypothetical protein